MKKRILLMSLAVSLAGLILFSVCSVAVFHSKLIDNSLNYLRVYMLSFEKNADKFSKFDLSAAKSLSAETGGARVTFMDYKGNVLSDSEAENFVNHSDRKEVKDALSSLGEGFATRHSSSVQQDLIYYCKQYDDFKVLVRLAVPLSSAADVLLSQLPLLICFLILDAAACILLSFLLVRFVMKPVEKFSKTALESGDAFVYAPYPELSQFATIISDLKRDAKSKVLQISEDRARENLVLDNMDNGLIILDKAHKPALINKTAAQLLKYQAQETYVNYLMSDREICKLIEGTGGTAKRGINSKIYLFKVSSAKEGKIILITDITVSERAAKSKDEFIANVTHEMNTPLTSISGFAELLSAGGMKGDKVKHAGEIIVKESKRLEGLVKSILSYSAIESDDVVPYNLSLSQAAEAALIRLTPQATAKNVTLVNKIEQDIFVKSTLERIGEVFDNLMSNAIRYNKENGAVTVEVGKKKERAYLSVIDTGIGIEKENMDKIFDRFYTVDPSHSGKNGGFGLGLAIVKKMAKLSGWEVNVVSEKDKGSAFTILF